MKHVGKWTLVTHMTLGEHHELARPGLEDWLAPSIVVSEGPATEDIYAWHSGKPHIALLRDVIENEGWQIVLEDVRAATPFVAFPRVLPLDLVWTLGGAIAAALAELHAADHVLGGMIPAIVFIDDDLDVTFAPRVLAFRGDARVDDVTALVALLRERIAPADRESLDDVTRDARDAKTLAERFREHDGATREALAAWLALDCASLSRRIGWVLAVARPSDEKIVEAFDEIATRLGAEERIDLAPPSGDDPSSMLDSEIVWEMQRGGRASPRPPTVREAVASLLSTLERRDAQALERACTSVLPNRLAHESLRCPSCGSSRVSMSRTHVWEIDEASCASCGRRELVDLHQRDEWYRR